MEIPKFKFNPHSLLDKEHQAYEHYKMVWMLNHGYTLHNILLALDYCMSEYSEDFDEAIENFENNIGFHGEIWPYFYEFMQCEYHECGYDKEES